MANELAAIATLPKGATITVERICAPHITARSSAIGKLTWKARFKMREAANTGRSLRLKICKSGQRQHK